MSSPQHKHEPIIAPNAIVTLNPPLSAHHELWKSIQYTIEQDRVVQTFLLIGSETTLIPFVNRWIAMFMCQESLKPCGQCLACRRHIEGIHPDVTRIQAEGKGTVKIEQIRDLIDNVYQTPQCGARRYVVLETAEKLNASSANALLKLLEEPPEHAIFFLLSKHLSHLPATLVSRCQRYVIPDETNQSLESQIALNSGYIDELLSLLTGNISPVVLADKWSKNDISEMVSWLYQITILALKIVRVGYQSNKNFDQIAHACSPETWFKQLDRIHQTSKSLQQRMNLNANLTLTYLLIGFCDVN